MEKNIANHPEDGSVKPTTDANSTTDATKIVDDAIAENEEFQPLMHDDSEEDKTPGLVYGSLVLTIVAWVAMLLMPGGSSSKMITEAIVLLLIGAASIVMSVKGRKRAPSLSVISIIIASSLMLFAIVCLVVLFFFSED